MPCPTRQLTRDTSLIRGPRFLALVSLLLLLWLDAWQTRLNLTARFIDILPPAIEPAGLAMRNVHTGLFSAIVDDRCGTTVIGISEVTAERINSEGLAFFETAERSRSVVAARGSAIDYATWQKLPQTGNRSIGDAFIMTVFSCAGRRNIPSRQIIEGLESGNAYVSSAGGSDFYVLPDQRLFVHAFID